MPGGRVSQRTSYSLKPVAKSDRRLGPMADAVQTSERGQVIGRAVVNESPILGAHEDVTREVQIGSRPVNECRASLRACPGEIPRVEDQGANTGQRKGRD